MLVMIFEYWVDEAHVDEYSDLSREMWQLVNDIDGFIAIERFTSATDAAKKLAIAYFRDEAAVRQWRNHPQHRRAQALGRLRLFTDYRLRMAQIIRDYGLHDRERVPEDISGDSRRDAQRGAPKITPNGE